MDNNNGFEPQGGNIVGADNQVYNIVDLLGGGTPVNEKIYDITMFKPLSSLIIGSDNRLYDLVKLINQAIPSVSVSAVEGGHQFTITDSNGENTFTVLDGKVGPKGDTGETGATGPQGPKGDTGDIGALKINGKAPDASGAVTLNVGDIGYGDSDVGAALSQLKDDLQTKTRINYLRPTVQTSTQNGVTCTNNGDGTYTLNGTASEFAVFRFMLFDVEIGKTYKFVGCPAGGDNNTYSIWTNDGINGCLDVGYGATYTARANFFDMTIQVRNGVACNNLVFKPMITDDLEATYDDFVSYDDSLVKGRDIMDQSSIGDAWTSGKTYAVGDYCISGNRLYKCKTAHTAGSAFNADYWDAVSVAAELAKIINALNLSI